MAVAFNGTVAGAANVAPSVGPVSVTVGGTLLAPKPRVVTLSRVAVPSTLTWWLVTANPTKAVTPTATVSLPIKVQLTPSAKTYALNNVPLRTSFTQRGGPVAPPEVYVVPPPAPVRRSKATPLLGVTSTVACRAPGVRLSRIITPAFAQGSVFCTLATRATICPSPAST